MSCQFLRCDRCKFWTREQVPAFMGVCSQLSYPKINLAEPFTLVSGYKTSEDFGCTEFVELEVPVQQT